MTFYASQIFSNLNFNKFQQGFPTLYYRVVVFRVPLQGLCYTVRDTVDWCPPPTTRWFYRDSNHGPLIGIDVAKDKHDCFIISAEGEVLEDVFTIPNTLEGFNLLLSEIRAHTKPQDNIKVGLETTRHYSYNLLGFLLNNGLHTYVLNPLQTNLYRKGLTLRKAKTDRVDARMIASMLLSDMGLKPYTDTAYHIEELKSLTRYRFDKVQDRAKLKSSVTRLVCILFPELEKLVPSLHMVSVYELLEEIFRAKQIAPANLTHLKNLLSTASRGRYGREKAIEIRNAAKASIGSQMPAKSLELQHTIRLIRELDQKIGDIEAEIQKFMDDLDYPITTIPGVGTQMGAMILDEVGDFSCFDSPDKVLAYAGLSPSTYQSGQLKRCYLHMEKRGLGICAMPCLALPNMFVSGPPHSPLTLRRSEVKASTTSLPFLTLPRNWYA